MARIQIPLDVLTSRLNLGDRFAGVRSQSLTSRFANLRPISDFFDFKRVSKPDNFSEVQARVNYNLSHFSSNYALVFLMLSIYSLLSNFTLIFLIVLVVGGFFRGGGLGGRPRSPKRVPSWGRPPGAKGSKQRRKWEREQALWLEKEGFRIEELDSDDTDTQGVGLELAGKRFVSDPLRFTGVELSQARSRRAYDLDGTDSDSEDSGSRSDDSVVSARQIALRDKEEALVQSALARIRRAQERGKQEVKLNPDELAALERRRKKMQSAATASKTRKERSGSGGSSGEHRKRRDSKMVTVPIVQPQPRRHSDRVRDQSPPRTASGGPGMIVEGPGGVLSYAPIGYSSGSPKRGSPTRPRSSTSSGHQSRNTPPPYTSDYSKGGRHFSEEIRPTSAGNPRLPLPHEEGWIPGSRRSSVSSNYSHDPFEYQTSTGPPPPIPEHYLHMQAPNSGRRNVSGPPQVSYSSVRRSPPVGTSSSSSKMRHHVSASASDPNIVRRRGSEDAPDSLTDSEDDESDPENGVSLEPERPVAVVSRKPVGGNGGRKKGRR